MIAIVAGTVLYVTRTTHQPAAVQVGGAASGSFDKHGQLATNAERALFSPDGTRLAVVSSDGIGIGDGGTVRLVTPEGSSAVDAAWMPDSTSLLVAEGPAVADRLTVLHLDGSTKGVAKLDAPFSVGEGNGIAVDERGTRAVATSETRDPIGGRRHFGLMLVELTTGKVTPLSTDANVDEAWPVFAADNVLFARRTSTGRWQVNVLNLTSKTRAAMSPADEDAFPVGVLRTGQPVYASSRPGRAVSVWAVRDDGSRVRMAEFPSGTRVWTVEPGGTRAVVSEAEVVGGQPVTVVRAVTLHALESG